MIREDRSVSVFMAQAILLDKLWELQHELESPHEPLRRYDAYDLVMGRKNLRDAVRHLAREFIGRYRA
jgi:hypothetical protein